MNNMSFVSHLFDRLKTVKLVTAAPQDRLRDQEGSSRANLAAQMLTTPSALMQLTSTDARKVVSYMLPHRVAAGTTFIREGDTTETDFMILVLSGEVSVESIVVSRTDPIIVKVLGPGSLIGEMGLLDGEPRSASCTALTDLQCAVLKRSALHQLLQDDPTCAAKLLIAVSYRIAERMRDSADKLKLYAQLIQAMQQEIDSGSRQ